MAEKDGIYKCEICSNVVSMIEANAPEIICCGQTMTLQQEKTEEPEEFEEENEDDFDKIYKGEISKSGTAILPSKRMRRISEKINVNTKTADQPASVEKENQEP